MSLAALCLHPVFRVVEFRRPNGLTGVVATVCTTCAATWAARRAHGPQELHDKGTLSANVGGTFLVDDCAELVAGPSTDLEACQLFAAAENDRRYANGNARVGFYVLLDRLEMNNALYAAEEISRDEAERRARVIGAAMTAARLSEAA